MATFIGSGGGSNTLTSTTNYSFSSLLNSSNAAPTLQQNDLVLVTVSHSNATGSSRTLAQLTPTGYTAITGLSASVTATTTETNVCSLAVFYKFMTATPDTVVTIPAVAASGNSIGYTVEVFRYVDTTTPFAGVTPTSASAINGGLANPPSITTPSSPTGSVVKGSFGAAVASAAVFANSGATPYDSTLNVFRSFTSTGTNQSVVGCGTKTGLAVSTAFDAAITGSNTTNTGSNCAIAYVLKAASVPAATTPYPLSVWEGCGTNAMVGYGSPSYNSGSTPSLVDNAGGRFTMDTAGEIFVADASLIDYETTTSHNITVRQTQTNYLTTDTVLAVNVQNVIESATANFLTLAQGPACTNPVGTTATSTTFTAVPFVAGARYYLFASSYGANTGLTSPTLSVGGTTLTDIANSFAGTHLTSGDAVYTFVASGSADVVMARADTPVTVGFISVEVTGDDGTYGTPVVNKVTSVTTKSSTSMTCPSNGAILSFINVATNTTALQPYTFSSGTGPISANVIGGISQPPMNTAAAYKATTGSISFAQNNSAVSDATFFTIGLTPLVTNVTSTGGTVQTLSLTGKTGSSSIVTVTWNTTAGVNCNSNLSFTTNKLSFTQVTFASNNDAVRATSKAAPTKFIVEYTVSSSPAAFYLGVDDGTPDFSVTNFVPSTSATTTCLRWDSAEWLTYKNASWTGYQSATGLNAANGVITMIGDTSAGTLSFYLNGTLLNTITGVSYTNWYAFATNGDFAGNYDITANFAGPFTYPQTGYSAYDSGVGSTNITATGATAQVLAISGKIGSASADANSTGLVGSLSLAGKTGSSTAAVNSTALVGVLSIAGQIGSATSTATGTGGVGALALAGRVGSASANASGTAATAQVLAIAGLVGSSTVNNAVDVTATGATAQVITLAGQIGSATSNATGTGGVGALTLTGKTGSASADVSGTGTTGVLSLAGKIGSATAAVSATGIVGVMSIAGQTGSEIVSQTLTGGVGALAFAGKIGSASANAVGTAGTAQVLAISALTGSSNTSYPLTAATAQVLAITGLVGSSSANVSGTAGAGALALTGETGSASANATVNGGAGSLVLVGKQGSLTDDAVLTGQTGALSIAGQTGTASATINASGDTVSHLSLVGFTGTTDLPDAFDLTTEDDAILFTEDGQDLLIEATNFNLTGQTSQTLAITGFAGSFAVDASLTGQTGSLSIVGNAGTVTADAALTGQTGALAISGKTGSTSADAIGTGQAGALSIAGQAGSLTASANLTGQVGVLSIAGQTGSSAADANGTGSTGTLALAGLVGSSSADATANGGAGLLTITGFAGAVDVAIDLTGQSGALAIVGLQGSEADDANVAATGGVGQLTISGQQGSLASGVSPQGQAGALVVTGFAGTASADIAATGQTGEIALVGLIGSTNLSIDTTGQTGQLHIVGQAGAADFAGNITAFGSTGTLSLTGFAGSAFATSNVNLTGQAGALNLSGFAGSLSATIAATGATGLLNLVGKTGSSNASATANGQAGSIDLIGKTGSLSNSIRSDAGAGELAITGFAGSSATVIELQAGEVAILSITGFRGSVANNFTPAERRVAIAATNRKAMVAATNRRASIAATKRIATVEANNRLVSVAATNRTVVVEPTDRIVET